MPSLDIRARMDILRNMSRPSTRAQMHVEMPLACAKSWQVKRIQGAGSGHSG
jgi:hypothetical protein